MISRLRQWWQDLNRKPAILYGSGQGDSAPGLRAWQRGEPVEWASGGPVERVLRGNTFIVHSPWQVPEDEIDHPREMIDCEIIVKY